MQLPQSILQTPAFQYAQDVRDGRIVCGRRIKQAVARFWRWVDTCAGYMDRDAKGNLVFHKNENHDGKGFYIDHEAGMHILWFFPTYLNHTEGKLAGKPVHLAPFQAFTEYNVFAWKKMSGQVPQRGEDIRRIRKVYDRRGKKNSKSTEMAGLALYMMSYDEEPQAQIYIGATKEEQARICWRMAESFINSPWANPRLRKLGFETRQAEVLFPRNRSRLRALGGDSKTQDGINTQFGIVDEYHAHADDGVKENMESSMVMRRQPLLYQITTAGVNVHSACKRYEDSIIEILEERAEVDHVWIMIHEMDDGDDWENPENWVKANPLLHQGMEMSVLMERYEEVKISPSKINEFKTKNLNMWVDAPEVWINNDDWKRNKHNLSADAVLAKFERYGGFAGGDLSTKLDITAFVLLSNPDDEGMRYVIPFFFCPKDGIVKRSREDRVPYQQWADQGYIIATDGVRVDYNVLINVIRVKYSEYNINRIDFDPWNASMVISDLIDMGYNVSELPQLMPVLSEPTKELEALIMDGRIRHDGNPVLEWMLAGCKPIYDTKGNMMIAKGKSKDGAKRRIDGIAALINALAGSMSPDEENNDSVYNNLAESDEEFFC